MGAKRAEASARTGTVRGQRLQWEEGVETASRTQGHKRPSEQRVAATSSQSIEPLQSSLCGSVSEDEAVCRENLSQSH